MAPQKKKPSRSPSVKKPASRPLRAPRPPEPTLPPERTGREAPIPFSFRASVPAPVPLSRRLAEQFERSLSRPKVSVVVVNHDGVDFLWHCLFALRTQTYPPHEIILVDNASTDASVSFVRSNYPQVKILECQENFGYAMGSNLGAATATGDLVVLLNNDAVVTPDWLVRLAADFRDQWPGIGALACLVRPNQKLSEEPAREYRTLNILGNPVPGFLDDPREVFYPEGCALMYPRFLAADGPFDPDYFIYQEDVYFGWKLRLQDRGVRRSMSAKVFHEEGGTMSRYPRWRSVYYRTRNRWLNLLLFYDTSSLLKVMPWMGAEALGSLLKGFVTGFNNLVGTLLALAWVAFHPVAIYRKRQVLQEKRKAPDREILRYLSGRVVPDGGFLSRVLNFLSLTYCLLVELEVLEFQGED